MLHAHLEMLHICPRPISSGPNRRWAESIIRAHSNNNALAVSKEESRYTNDQRFHGEYEALDYLPNSAKSSQWVGSELTGGSGRLGFYI